MLDIAEHIGEVLFRYFSSSPVYFS